MIIVGRYRYPCPTKGRLSSLAERGLAVASGARFRMNADPAIRVTTAALEPERADLGRVISGSRTPPTLRTRAG